MGHKILEDLENEFMEAVWNLSQCSMWGEDEVRYTFRCLELESGLPRVFVRALCRRLTEKGLMTFSSGLVSENGEFVGSGYGLSPMGVAWCRENIDGQSDS